MNPFAFSSATMLLWGLAAVAPILIHLWNRRRYRETDWAAMKFLLAAMKKNRRRIQVEQLLLLLVRCAILLFFAIALADISCTGGSGISGFGGPGSATHTVLVIDQSYSMAYGEEGQTRLDQAKELARRIVNEAGEGDGFTLLAMGRTAKGIISEPAFDPNDVLRELEQIEIDPGVAALDLALAEIEGTLRMAARDFPRLRRAQVCILTDYGDVTWKEAASQTNEQVLAKIEELAVMQTFDVGQPQTTNSAIIGATQLTPYLTPNQSARFRVDLSCDNASQLPSQVVQMLVDGRLVSQKVVPFVDNQVVSVEMNTVFTQPGTHAIEFRLEDDLLATDNRRFIVVEVKPQLRILCLADDVPSLKFLKLALDPSDSIQSPVKVETMSASALMDIDLLSYDAVYLSNVAQIAPDEAAILRTFVQRGGGLVLFLGDRVQAASYNAALAKGDDTASSLIDIKLDGPTPRGEYFLDPRQYESPLLESFRGQQAGGLLTTPVWNYFKVTTSEDSTAQTALWFGTGDPAIVTSRYQTLSQDKEDAVATRLGGNVIVFCLPASTDSVDRSLDPPAAWTVFPTWPSFPPLVQESLSLAVASQFDRRNRELGDVFEGVIEGDPGANLIEVILPDDQSSRIEAVARDDRLFWAFDGTDKVGIYRSKSLSDRATEKVEFAVNADTRESDLSRVSMENVPPSLQPGDRGFDPASGGQMAAVPASVELFRYALVLVMGLLFFESFLAYRFGAAAR
ncbi:BatA domain-containing protein [Bremerella sp. P1]|uniref:BatA domain-containing protein n=1 Tax=Bremerella sp. P1 TaxID=3026424 RepID=UPI0023684E38|nr:BatA domain-containing protein [Bremerella sp. P1]WDI43271.1 BatA domain-containing protein [Bremerella sp. P1]